MPEPRYDPQRTAPPARSRVPAGAPPGDRIARPGDAREHPHRRASGRSPPGCAARAGARPPPWSPRRAPPSPSRREHPPRGCSARGSRASPAAAGCTAEAPVDVPVELVVGLQPWRGGRWSRWRREEVDVAVEVESSRPTAHEKLCTEAGGDPSRATPRGTGAARRRCSSSGSRGCCSTQTRAGRRRRRPRCRRPSSGRCRRWPRRRGPSPARSVKCPRPSFMVKRSGVKHAEVIADVQVEGRRRGRGRRARLLAFFFFFFFFFFCVFFFSTCGRLLDVAPALVEEEQAGVGRRHPII